jgi:hypothetical protein
MEQHRNSPKILGHYKKITNLNRFHKKNGEMML